MPKGRPTKYTDALIDDICREVALGSNLNKLSSSDDYPSRFTLYKWLGENEEFSNKYAYARECRADARADKIDDICEKVERGELDPTSARVIIDALKWQAGKEKPKSYGDKVTQEITGADGGPIETSLTMSFVDADTKDD